ncbi:MAG: hypothetical protein RMI89_05370 [Gloeomargarita sp. SKYBB_i_bin120]|nr:hypothetical protein [Gloeomargarita sp. SKYB120]MDW8177954.1 hypothetical protein [Gloeomargarita sp. SKYBB_i_bin120]
MAQENEALQVALHQQEQECKKLQSQTEQQAQEIAQLREQLEWYRKPSSNLEFRTGERGLYEGEIRDMILMILRQHLESLPADPRDYPRRKDILRDVLAHNSRHGEMDQLRQNIRQLFQGYTKWNDRIGEELRHLGFQYSTDGEHCKVTWRGDKRYTVTISTTPGDKKNAGHTVIQNFNQTFF